jgi:hypothetical protein
VVIDLGKLTVGRCGYGILNNKIEAMGNFYLSFGLISGIKEQLKPDISYWHRIR